VIVKFPDDEPAIASPGVLGAARGLFARAD